MQKLDRVEAKVNQIQNKMFLRFICSWLIVLSESSYEYRIIWGANLFSKNVANKKGQTLREPQTVGNCDMKMESVHYQ